MNLLQMSFLGAVMIFAVVIVRAIVINKLPKKTFLILWGVVLARLLLPFKVPSAFSIYSLAAHFAPMFFKQGEFTKGGITQIAMPENVKAVSAVPIVNEGQNVVSEWTVIWIAGALACSVFFAVSYYKCCKEFETSLPIKNDYLEKWLSEHQGFRNIEIRGSDRILAPLTYGIFHPVILIPKAVNRSDKASLDYILAHEYVHIRRFDTITKLIVTVTLCIHWFNPAVWVMYALINRDIELSCDEKVVRMFGEDRRTEYAMAIIRMAEIKSGVTPLCSNFSKNAIEERIVAIMKFKKSSFAVLAVASAIVITVSAAFATSANAMPADNKAGGESVENIFSEEIMLSRMGDNGKIQYSLDGGKTFFEEEDLNKQYPAANVEWWTYDEYKEWLENEKKILQGMLGERAYTGGNGYFIWTQEMIDDTVERYEKILKDIKDGLKISKLVDGSEDIMLAQYSNEEDVVYETSEGVTIVFGNGDKISFGPYNTTEELLADLKPYCEQQVQLGNMTQQEANSIIEKYE